MTKYEEARSEAFASMDPHLCAIRDRQTVLLLLIEERLVGPGRVTLSEEERNALVFLIYEQSAAIGSVVEGYLKAPGCWSTRASSPEGKP